MNYIFEILMNLTRPEGLAEFFSMFLLGCLGGGGGDSAKKAAKKQASAIAAGTQKVNEAFATYTPEFYEARKLAYEKAQLPQLGQQANRTEKMLSYNLANKGLFGSSIGAELGESLQNEYAQQKMNVADAAQSAANSLREQVENYRANLLGQVGASADPLSTAQSLITGASQFQSPSAIPAMTDAFGNWMNTYLLSNMNALNSSGGGQGSSYRQPAYGKGSISTVKGN